MIIRILLSFTALVLLSGFGYIQHQRGVIMSPDRIEAYHATIRRASAEVPYVIGDYVGEDIPIPQSAVELLKPNVILSRRYTNLGTGDTVDLLFVHCKDAQDMLGHHPPVCYPAHGWATEREDDIAEGQDRFATYTATRQISGQLQAIRITQGLLLYQQAITPKMQSALQMSTRRAWRALGAGQVQLIRPLPGEQTSLNEGFDQAVKSLAEAVCFPNFAATVPGASE